MEDALPAAALLWLAVVASGLYHGLNPGMGWPLAVSAALMEGRRRALFGALGALATGHFLAMTAVLLPFAAMTLLIDWEREIRLVAGAAVILAGLALLVWRRHPRFLARIPPSRLVLWSFLVALAHGAGLMLVPIYLGLCAPDELDAGHRAAAALMVAGPGLPLAVAAVHTGAMVLAGGAAALAVHGWFGLGALARSWLDLGTVWALGLILAGGAGVATAI